MPPFGDGPSLNCCIWCAPLQTRGPYHPPLAMIRTPPPPTSTICQIILRIAGAMRLPALKCNALPRNTYRHILHSIADCCRTDVLTSDGQRCTSPMQRLQPRVCAPSALSHLSKSARAVQVHSLDALNLPPTSAFLL